MKFLKVNFFSTIFKAIYNGIYLGVGIGLLIELLSNDSLSIVSTLLVLLWLAIIYSVISSFFLSIFAFISSIFINWNIERLFLFVIFSLLTIIYIWNLYIYRLFFKGSQILILAVEILFFASFLLINLFQIFEKETHLKNSFLNKNILPITGLLIILIVNSFVPSLKKIKTVENVTYPKITAKTQLIVFGLDGADWDIILPMHKMGKTPCISRFIKIGNRHLLKTFDPTSSPLIWTTISTGKDPFNHGIRDFGIQIVFPTKDWISVLPKGAGLLKIAALSHKLGIWKFNPSSSVNKRSKTIWKIISEAGIDVSVNNWPVTVPVSSVKGIITGETEYFLYHGITPENVTYPPFIENAFPMKSNTSSSKHTKQSSDVLTHDLEMADEIALQLQRQFSIIRYEMHKWPTPLTMFYTHSLDLIQHLFWRFGFKVAGNEKAIGKDEVYNRIEKHILLVDREFSKIFDDLSSEPVVLILSDHGFRTIYLFERLFNWRSKRIQGVHDFAPYGLFLLSGPGIKSNTVGSPVSVFDITPSILQFFTLPLAKDMQGATFIPEVYNNFSGNTKYISTYETSTKYQKQIKKQNEGDKHIESKLRLLGYIE